MHLIISVAIAAIAAVAILGLWYPYPFREISGGRALIFLLTVVDVVLGPLVTLAIFNKAKSWPVLKKDLTLGDALQLAALVYGS